MRRHLNFAAGMILLWCVSPLQADEHELTEEQRSRVQVNIERAKETLGDRLAKTADELRHSRIDGNFVECAERGISYEYLGLHSFYTEPTVFYHLRRTFGDGFVEELYFGSNRVSCGFPVLFASGAASRADPPYFSQFFHAQIV